MESEESQRRVQGKDAVSGGVGERLKARTLSRGRCLKACW